MARAIVAEPALGAFVSHELSPGKDVQSDAEWDTFTNRNRQSIYHACGTARMGTSPMTVVGPDLRVHGIAGLRVADASVMPTVVSGNTQAAVFKVAEEAADLVGTT